LNDQKETTNHEETAFQTLTDHFETNEDFTQIYALTSTVRPPEMRTLNQRMRHT
jgi:hypothetical protein